MGYPFATHADLAARWKTLTAADQTRADTLLGSASREIRRELPDIDTWVTAATIDPDTVIDVACSVVKRAMTLTAGIRQRTVDVDGMQVTTSGDSAPEDEIYLTAREVARLTPASTAAASAPVPLYSFPDPSGYPC